MEEVAMQTTFPSLVSIDIETYGILKGQQQRFFHPVQSKILDQRSPECQVVTVAFAWETPGGIDAALYVWKEQNHRRKVEEWFRLMRLHGSTLLGFNTLFDLSYLRAASGSIRYHSGLHPNQSRILLDDVAIINFLDFEERPEKSLKTLSTLFGVGDYQQGELSVKELQKFVTSGHNKTLQRYNVEDAVNNLKHYRLLLSRVKERWPGSAKLSSICKAHRDCLLRIGLEMKESGIQMDLHKLLRKHLEHTQEVERLEEGARSEYSISLSGKGSAGDKKKIVMEAMEGGLLDDPEVQFTEKKHEVCVNKSNLELLLSKLPASHPQYKACQLMYDHVAHKKLLDSYYVPLLHKPSKGLISHRVPRCYPSWHLVPSFAHKGSTTAYGTIQGRITCTKPGFQTWPPEVRECMKSRWPQGKLLSVDYSQLELYIAALLSQDRLMVEETQQGIDRHSVSGQMICETVGVRLSNDDPLFRKVWRQMGKTLNFLVLYRGGANKYLETLIKMAGEMKNVELLKIVKEKMNRWACHEVLSRFDSRYHEFRSWQESLINLASEQGYLEVETGWSRTFSGGPATIRRTYINEICNFPIQTVAAQITQAAQFQVLMEMRKESLRAPMCAQTYDSILIDSPRGEVDFIKKILKKVLPRPYIMDIFERSRKLVVTLKYEIEEK